MLFDQYLFADYSGAFDARGQRKCIRLAAASVDQPSSIIERKLTRQELVNEIAEHLEAASCQGKRVCFGQDHQYGLPVGLVNELGLAGHTWRRILDCLATGGYGQNAPSMDHPRVFARSFNEWLVARGGKPYFYSATKSQPYGVPRYNPRSGDDACYRLSELQRSLSGTGTPKPFNRVGDPGTVGGQSLVGILAIRALLALCSVRNVRVAVWPFDGLSILDEPYMGAHVMIEPYPSAVRDAGVVQTDEADASACADHIRLADRSGSLETMLDLSSLGPADAAVVVTEGWIVSHQPNEIDHEANKRIERTGKTRRSSNR